MNRGKWVALMLAALAVGAILYVTRKAHYWR